MLRMTRSVINGTGTLILEGKLLKPWIEALRAELAANSTPGVTARIDLAALSFLDAAGAKQLLELERQGFELSGASVLIRGLLDMHR
jgi:ABC-type transporter Mla MlaB component